MQKACRFTLPLVAALVLAAAPASTRYVVEGQDSNVSAKVAFFGIASKTARFPDISGEVRLDRERPQDLAIDVTIDARTLQAPDSITLGRLKGEKFFWVEKYPTIRFVGTHMSMHDSTGGEVAGELTARGVTRPVTLDISFDQAPASAMPGDALALTGTTTIDRREFGMTSYSLIVGKKVDITIKARMIPS